MNKRDYFVLTMAIPALVATTADRAFAETFLTQEQALQFAFGKEAKSETEVKSLTPEQKHEFQKKLGFVFDPNKTDFTFYKGIINGNTAMYAYIDVVPGKWGPITYVIAITPEGKVNNMSVTELMERRGRPVKERRFLDQFVGKTTESKLELNKDVKQVAGATISSTGMNNGVRKVLALFKHFYPAPQVINNLDEVIKNSFPKEAEVIAATKSLSEKDMETLTKQYEGKLKLQVGENVTIYTDKKDEKLTNLSVVCLVNGENGAPVKYLLTFSPEMKISQIVVLSVCDSKDKLLADKAFLEQFNGKDLAGLLALNAEKDIKGVETLAKAPKNFTEGLKRSLALLNFLKDNGKLAPDKLIGQAK